MADVVFSSSRFRLHGCTVEKKLNKTSLKDFGGIVLAYSLNQYSRVPNRPEGLFISKNLVFAVTISFMKSLEV